MKTVRVYDFGLLESARSGDPQALLRLLSLAHPDIRRYARRSCRHSEDADDAVQETMMQVHKQMGSLRVLAAFSGWLSAIVRRECTRLYRTVFRWTDIAGLENDERLARLPADELRLDLSRCIESLPLNYREIVLLRDCEEMTIDEICAQLDLTREAVKARLHRARKLMREYLTR